MSPAVLSVDVGTSGVRAAVVTDDGSVATAVYRQVLPTSPMPNFVEFDPAALAAATLEVSRAALDRWDGRVEAVGITNQRASTVLWDRRTGEVLGPGVGWQDLRTVGMCLALQADGLRLAPNASATKLAFLLDLADPDRARAGAGELCFGTIDTWLAWTLTGGAAHVTDPGNAGVTGLVRPGFDRWDTDVLAALRIPEAVLPTIVDSSGFVAPATALPGAPPVAGLAGDQQASLLGQGAVTSGAAKLTLGTGGMLDVCVGPEPPAFLRWDRRPVASPPDRPGGRAGTPPGGTGATAGGAAGRSASGVVRGTTSGAAEGTAGDAGTGTASHPGDHRSGSARGPAGTIPVAAWRRRGVLTWGVEAIAITAGTAVEWLRDGLGVVPDAAATEAIAESVSDSGGVVFVPAFLGAGTPRWDYGARGGFFGLSRGTGRAELVRAVLEGVAHRGADLLAAAEADSGLATGTLRVDGGMSANGVVLQALADFTGRAVEASAEPEATTLGAAFLAGMAVGIWPDEGATSALFRARCRVEPAIDEPRRREARDRFAAAMEGCAGWVPELSAITF